MTTDTAPVEPGDGHRLVSLREAAAATGLSVDELRAAYLAGAIAGRTQYTTGGRVYAFQVVLDAAHAHVDRLVGVDAQGRAIDRLVRDLRAAS